MRLRDSENLYDYWVVQNYGKYLLLQYQKDYYSVGDALNARYLYNIEEKSFLQLPVNKSNIAYLAPDGIYSFQWPNKGPYKLNKFIIQKMDYDGKNKKTLLKGYDFCYLADTHALIYKKGKYYIFTYKTKNIKRTKKYDNWVF